MTPRPRRLPPFRLAPCPHAAPSTCLPCVQDQEAAYDREADEWKDRQGEPDDDRCREPEQNEDAGDEGPPRPRPPEPPRRGRVAGATAVIARTQAGGQEVA